MAGVYKIDMLPHDSKENEGEFHFMIFNIFAAVWEKLGWAKSLSSGPAKLHHALRKYSSECYYD